MAGPAVGVYAARPWTPALRDNLREWLCAEAWHAGDLKANADRPWEFSVLLPENRPFAGHPHFASGIIVDLGGSYPSEQESAALEQALGYAPQTEITISVWRGDSRDHHVSAWLAAEVAERLGGLLDLDRLALPKDIDLAAATAGQVLRVTWEEEAESPCPGVRIFHKMIATPAFVRNWRQHRRFYLLK